jgi:hypothetical protein
VGFFALTNYDLKPGISARLPACTVNDLELPSNGHWSLVMFVHPRCACSTASILELARLVDQSHVPLDIRIWFFSPLGEPEAWARTTLWRQASEIPGATLLIDFDGREARQFDAATSGQTFVYAPDGRLVFAGGITASRGHHGPNPSSDQLADILSDRQVAGQAATQVFGCPLSDSKRSMTEAN